MNRHEWNYQELDNIYFKQSEAEIECLRAVNRGFSPKKATSRLGTIGQKIYKGDEGKFIKSLQECLNYDEPENDIADGYTSLMKIGYQPDLIHLSQLETIHEHVEWKQDKDTKRRNRQQAEKKQKQTQQAQHLRHMQWKKEQEEENNLKTLTKESLMSLSGSKDDELSQRHRRLITFDMASETTSKEATEKSQMSQYKLINLKKNRHEKDDYRLIEQKCEPQMRKDESPRMSERSETTANTSNLRSHYTLSPTKTRRDQQNFSRAATNMMQSITLNTEFSKDDFRSEEGAISPDVRHRGGFMPGQSLFDFRNKNVTERNITSAKGNRAFSPMKKYLPSQSSAQVNRMNSLMNNEYKTLTDNMMKNN